ncbi:hypothetical protein BBBOND_0206430 [Babesia bigemina]|uniref:Uncharacterized protein n=1 Tax=Babesia bigemina TaxID=5866 RepID=A0A061DCD3_BABBI|nr:hypothetical protein BBBOND_0206430 [Babesia bigemina]CDR95485.1 hypothetical protein BBBOND_0206430 [Babesia bigemina]|eukprot:XP_012767671.1 hypothetical protein BBBOND_0206430 [Babesia bigemina]
MTMAARRQRSRSRNRLRVEGRSCSSRWRAYQSRSRRSMRSRSISNDRERWVERSSPRNSDVSRDHSRETRRVVGRSPSGSPDKSVRTGKRGTRRSRDRSDSRLRDFRRRQRHRRSSSASRSVRPRHLRNAETRRRKRSVTRSPSLYRRGSTSSDDNRSKSVYRDGRADRIRDRRRIRSRNRGRSRSDPCTPDARRHRVSRRAYNRRDIRRRVSRSSSIQSKKSDEESVMAFERVVFREGARIDEKHEPAAKDVEGYDTMAGEKEANNIRVEAGARADRHPHCGILAGFPPPRPYRQREDFFDAKHEGTAPVLPELPESVLYGDRVSRYHSQDPHEQTQQADDEARDMWLKYMIDMVETNATIIKNRLEVGINSKLS